MFFTATTRNSREKEGLFHDAWMHRMAHYERLRGGKRFRAFALRVYLL
jgi:DNA-directed RNA polymerase specialized sigma24 family protein